MNTCKYLSTWFGEIEIDADNELDGLNVRVHRDSEAPDALEPYELEPGAIATMDTSEPSRQDSSTAQLPSVTYDGRRVHKPLSAPTVHRAPALRYSHKASAILRTTPKEFRAMKRFHLPNWLFIGLAVP